MSRLLLVYRILWHFVSLSRAGVDCLAIDSPATPYTFCLNAPLLNRIFLRKCPPLRPNSGHQLDTIIKRLGNTRITVVLPITLASFSPVSSAPPLLGTVLVGYIVKSNRSLIVGSGLTDPRRAMWICGTTIRCSSSTYIVEK